MQNTRDGLELDYQMKTLNTERRKVDLKGRIRGGAGIKFLFAELPDAHPLPFAVVYYMEEGERQVLGLRLDLDKKVFLDHFDEVKKEKILQRAAPDIVSYLGNERRHHAAA